MLKTTLLAIICLFFQQQFAAAQPPLLLMKDDDGKALFMLDNYDFDGSPYYNDNYITAQLTDVNGLVYSNLKIKVNLSGHKIQYMNEKGDELVTGIPMKKIKFLQYPSADGQWGELTLVSYGTAINEPGSSVYTVIDSGKISLLKKTSVDYHDEKKYNAASTTRVFERKETYAILLPGGEIKPVEKGRAAVAALFPDKQKQVEDFIQQNKLKCNSADDYKKVVRFYNTL